MWLFIIWNITREDEAENEDENGIEMNENEFQKEVTPEEMTDEEIIKSPKALNAIKCMSNYPYIFYSLIENYKLLNKNRLSDFDSVRNSDRWFG